MRFTYDPSVDAVYLYLVDAIGRGEVAKDVLVHLPIPMTSISVSTDSSGRALGVEFLGASRLLGPQLLAALLAERSHESRDRLGDV